MNNFSNLLNHQIGSLRITGIAGRDAKRKNAPVWIAECTQCGSSGQTFRHDELINRSAKCKASICGKPIVEQTRGTAIGVGPGIRTSDVRSRQQFEQTDKSGSDYQRRFDAYVEAYGKWLRREGPGPVWEG